MAAKTDLAFCCDARLNVFARDVDQPDIARVRAMPAGGKVQIGARDGKDAPPSCGPQDHAGRVVKHATPRNLRKPSTALIRLVLQGRAMGA